MSGTTAELLLIFILVLANGVFALSEMAVVKARKVRLKQWAREGNRRAGVALGLAESPNRFLSTVQIGITLIGILAGAVGGATVAGEIAQGIKGFSYLAPYGEAIGVGIVVLAITFVTLVLGELAPKRIALNNPERIAIVVAGPMRILSTLAYPVVRVLGVSTSAVLRVLGSRPSREPPVTEEEIRIMIEQGTRLGVFEESEQEMVESVFILNDQRVSAVMTPRPEIEWLDLDDSASDNLAKTIKSSHSLLPVGQGNLDNVVGVAAARDILSRSTTGLPVDPGTVVLEPLVIPESMTVPKLLEAFKTHKPHIALVVDEHGGTEGMVTLNDILGEIAGGISLYDKSEEPEVIQREDGSLLLDGMLSIEEFKKIFELRDLPGEELGHYQTVGGFVMRHVGRLPKEGDLFVWKGMRFEVVDMDDRRVDKVLVVKEADTA